METRQSPVLHHSHLATAEHTLSTHESTWWRNAVVYQVYPRSFADADGDGVGDLTGITSRVPYLKALGVDAVWISPFYPSALADGGYDVDHYRDVHPQLGTLATFDRMIERLHQAGLRVIVDIVPNHTSDRHPWFREAISSSAGSPARDRYLFRDGLGRKGSYPPADWISRFGGPAWEPVGDGQWYFHHYAVQQPDLNWKNREVRDDFLSTIRFWADRGVDAFRIDIAHGLAKDIPEHGPLPSGAELDQMPLDGNHPLWDRDEVHDIYAEWRKVFDEYSPPRAAVAEAWVPTERRSRYASPKGLGQAFNFDLLKADFDAEQFRQVITADLDLAQRTGSSSTWVLSNHDVIRHATRYALSRPQGSEQAGQTWLAEGKQLSEQDLGIGLRRAQAATLLTLALPGSSYLYQGEELGLPEVLEIPPEQRQDPVFVRTHGTVIGRDGCRVALPWQSHAPSFGFGGAPPLPQPSWFTHYAVERQQDDPRSTLSLYRSAIRARRGLYVDDDFAWLPTRPDMLAFRRSQGWTCITNFGALAYPDVPGTPIISTQPLVNGQLPSGATIWTMQEPTT